MKAYLRAKVLPAVALVFTTYFVIKGVALGMSTSYLDRGLFFIGVGCALIDCLISWRDAKKKPKK